MDLPQVISFNDCPIKVYRSFAATCHSVGNVSINEFYIFPIMLALCLMLSVTHYAQYYAGIIGGSLHTDAHTYVYTHTCNTTHNIHRNL